MPMIDITKTNQGKDLLLTVDGRPIEDSSVSYLSKNHSRPILSLWSAAVEEIGLLPVGEILAKFDAVYFRLDIHPGVATYFW